MHFVKGKVYFILDLDSGSDPNNYPLVLLNNSFKNVKHFTSWLGFCPCNRISGGKVKSF
ncbi:transposase [Nostoc sp. LEGE 12450]|uniref:transposase n=1 Tax=Nostoc sp. LEGE 12450 TaxID=1828643 RepID=UPI001881B305|nr:transposase [Nostoc sp. LEGE 12450]